MTKDTIYRLIRQRQLAATQIGRAYRIPKEDLQRFLQSRSTRPEVRDAQFRQVWSIAERRQGVSSDELLEELEQEDRERKPARP